KAPGFHSRRQTVEADFEVMRALDVELGNDGVRGRLVQFLPHIAQDWEQHLREFAAEEIRRETALPHRTLDTARRFGDLDERFLWPSRNQILDAEAEGVDGRHGVFIAAGELRA